MFDLFFNQYLETLLWSECDDNGDPLDNDYDIDDIGNVDDLKENARDFYDAALPLINEAIENFPYNMEQAGHDFALTRNGHGAGFWDRGLLEVGNKLTQLSKTYGSCNLYVGDDKKVYSL